MDFTGEFSRSPFVHKMFPHVKSEDFFGGEHIKHHPRETITLEDALQSIFLLVDHS